MSAIKIAHLADIHYCAKHLRWVDRAMDHAVGHAIEQGAECAVISGDSFDAAINLHEPAVTAFFAQMRRLAERMPVLVLQGTFSHDRPGALSPLRALGPDVFVADRIQQVALSGGTWHPVSSSADLPATAQALFSCLPSINKGAIAASLGVEQAAEQAGEIVLALCRAWAPTNERARGLGVPTITVSHGTVNGCVTETARAMVSPDHEFTAPALFASGASAIMLGHIHAHQSWQDGLRQIAYPGSLTKMIYGHKGDTGYLLWVVNSDMANFVHIPCPSREMIEAEFDGPPDMDVLATAAAAAEGAYVRIRYSVDEEHRHAVDRDAILALFSTAEEVKIEASVNPVQRVRAAGISQAPTLADRLVHWCRTTDTNPVPLMERLDRLMAGGGAVISDENKSAPWPPNDQHDGCGSDRRGIPLDAPVGRK